MRKRLIIILLCITAALAAVAVWYVVYQRLQEQEIKNEHPTDDIDYLEDGMPHADPLLVGKWQNTDYPQWYKAYYDDYDEETRLFWGKEWDESADVHEEDLAYHGNGWFRWEKKGKILHEYATMDICDVPIHRAYKIRKFTTDSLVYFEPDHKKILYRFAKE